MKVLLASIGTRGDIEPFLALGEKLRYAGHDIMYLFIKTINVLIPNHVKNKLSVTALDIHKLRRYLK